MNLDQNLLTDKKGSSETQTLQDFKLKIYSTQIKKKNKKKRVG